MLAYRARIPRPASRWPLPLRPDGAALGDDYFVRCQAEHADRYRRRLINQLERLGHKVILDPYPQSHNASSAQPVLPGIARSQRPASIVQTAARAAEEVVNLPHNCVTRPARCRSSRKGASRESAGRRPKHRRGQWRGWLFPHRGKAVVSSLWRGAGRDRTRPASRGSALTRRCRSLNSTRAHERVGTEGLPRSALRDGALRDPFVEIVCERAWVACPHVGRDGVVEGLLEVGAQPFAVCDG
jgi:hypothetical protein